MACRCGCGLDTADAELIAILQAVRDKFGPVRITSGNRCHVHNEKEGGSKGSRHIRSRAADFIPLEAELKDVHRFIDDNYPNTGLGLYSGWIHVDSRGYKARW